MFSALQRNIVLTHLANKCKHRRNSVQKKGLVKENDGKILVVRALLIALKAFVKTFNVVYLYLCYMQPIPVQKDCDIL